MSHPAHGGSISPPMRNSMMSLHQDNYLLPNKTQSQHHTYEPPFRINNPSEFSQEREAVSNKPNLGDHTH